MSYRYHRNGTCHISRDVRLGASQDGESQLRS